MKKRRSLLLVVLMVLLCAFLTGCSTSTDVSDVEASFDDRTVTVSSLDDNTFSLVIEIEANSTKSSVEVKNLQVAGGVPHTYAIEDLTSSYISEDARITSVNIVSATITDDTLLVLVCGLIWGFVLGTVFTAIRDI